MEKQISIIANVYNELESDRRSQSEEKHSLMSHSKSDDIKTAPDAKPDSSMLKIDPFKGFLRDKRLPTHTPKRLFLHIVDTSNFVGQPVADINKLPVYGIVSDKADNVMELQYMAMYAYNGAYTICCCCYTGAHVCDLEHVTVRINKKTGRILSVFFAAHGYRDGYWRFASQGGIQLRNGAHPVVYVAQNGHGHYHAPGRWLRIGGFANDKTDDKGVAWKPKVVLLEHREEKTLHLFPEISKWLHYLTGTMAPVSI